MSCAQDTCELCGRDDAQACEIIVHVKPRANITFVQDPPYEAVLCGLCVGTIDRVISKLLRRAVT